MPANPFETRRDGRSSPIVPGNEASTAPTLLLRFDLGDKRLALDAACVVEVVSAVAVAAVPKGPPVLEGVINYHGRIVPVLDARSRLQVPPRALAVDEHMIVARAGPRTVALRVDRAVDLLTVEADKIEDAAAAVPEAQLAAGVVRLVDGVLVIHDLVRFLEPEEASAVDASVRLAAGGGPVVSSAVTPDEGGP